MAKHNESHPTERADLLGCRFVSTVETGQGKAMAEVLMKQLTGGDPVRARKIYKDFIQFDPTFKLFLAANYKPVIRGTDLAAWRRIKMIPFTVTIPDEQKDKHIDQKLRLELPGIMAWAVRGCLDWQRDGLQEPDEVRQATAKYRAEMDVVQQFIDDRCKIHANARCKHTTLFAAYQEYSADKVLTPYQFREKLKAKGFESRPGTGNVAYWHGIGLRPTDDATQAPTDA